MNTYNLEKLKNITIKDLKSYFSKNSWTENLEPSNQNFIIFKKEYSGESFEIYIPSNEKFKDYIARVYDSLILISELEETSPMQIIEDIYKANTKLKFLDSEKIYTTQSHAKSKKRDKLSIRVDAGFADDHVVPISYAQDVINGIRNLIVAAIYTEEQPRKYFIKPSKSSLDTLNNFYFAQTSPGSYIFNVESDIIVESEQVEMNIEGQTEISPITRRAISRIQNGIEAVNKGIKEGGIDEVFEIGYLNGLNANMCEAILNFQGEKENIKIETMVEWSDLLPKPNNIPEKTSLDSVNFKIIESLSEAYREDLPEEVALKGRITSIDRDFKRIIFIKAYFKERERKIKVVDMNLNDFQLACEALKHNDNVVYVEGEIEKKGRTYTLYSYKNFEVKF